MSMIDFEDRMPAPPLSIGEKMLIGFIVTAGSLSFGWTAWHLGLAALAALGLN